MQWLIMNMWMILATVAVFAILMGWSLRGLFSSSAVRRAEIEREIVQTELNQTRAEVEALYQAQRKRPQSDSETNDALQQLQADLSSRDGKIAELEAARTALQAENEALVEQHAAKEESVLPALGGAIAGAVAGSALADRDTGDVDAMKNLEDRNAWLEARIAELENDITQNAENAAPLAPTETGISSEKLQWQAGYLRQRVNALEASIVAQKSATPIAAPATEAGPDEDMARLRWRNRYLEGRLAYYEEQTPDIGEEDRSNQTEVQSLLDPDETTPPLAAATIVDETPSDPPAPSLLDAEPDQETHPSDAMLAEMDDEASATSPDAITPLQPEAMPKPAKGGDDLTLIDGIGPKIAEVLNGLGIWTHGQIASWTAANEAWIDAHLAFQGRVARENWVAQAAKVGGDGTVD